MLEVVRPPGGLVQQRYWADDGTRGRCTSWCQLMPYTRPEPRQPDSTPEKTLVNGLGRAQRTGRSGLLPVRCLIGQLCVAGASAVVPAR